MIVLFTILALLIIVLILLPKQSRHGNGTIKIVNESWGKTLLFDDSQQGIEQGFPYMHVIINDVVSKNISGPIVCIGLGMGFIPNEIHKKLKTDVQVIEIDPLVIDIVDFEIENINEIKPRRWPSKVGVINDDAYNVIQNTYETATVIILDAYNAQSKIPDNINSLDFIKFCYEACTESGVLYVNVFGDNRDVIDKVQTVFGNVEDIGEGVIRAVKSA
jgi:spermidine synthase